MVAKTPDVAARPGIFLSRGQALRIPAGALKISVNADGTPSARLERIEVSLDVAALWLRVAMDQLAISVSSHERAVEASKVNDDTALGAHLEEECAAGMLAICSAAFALDAFYAALKDRLPRVAKIPLGSGTRRSARAKIITEAIRREFLVRGKGLQNLRNSVKEVFRFRDYAVHPRADFALPVLKPEINRATEWRFVSFGAPTAQSAVRVSLAILYQVVDRPRNPNKEVASYLDGLRPGLKDLAARWRHTYGVLTDEG